MGITDFGLRIRAFKNEEYDNAEKLETDAELVEIESTKVSQMVTTTCCGIVTINEERYPQMARLEPKSQIVPLLIIHGRLTWLDALKRGIEVEHGWILDCAWIGGYG
ncbi:MAG: hypothetical protein M1812_000210 [Candelaria pacifica]|nr:MAG: hypothetical protein M1812_000210 [Candelaria pacifica]